jgi:hypothetical protein
VELYFHSPIRLHGVNVDVFTLFHAYTVANTRLINIVTVLHPNNEKRKIAEVAARISSLIGNECCVPKSL